MGLSRESKHKGKVAALGCILCRHLGFEPSPAEVHHIYDTADKSDFLTIGLCPEHHRGKSGFHGMGERAFNRVYGTSETKLLAETLRLMA